MELLELSEVLSGACLKIQDQIQIDQLLKTSRILKMDPGVGSVVSSIEVGLALAEIVLLALSLNLVHISKSISSQQYENPCE